MWPLSPAVPARGISDNRNRRGPLGDREHAEQVAVINWAALGRSQYPDLELLYAIPNGGHRHPRVAGRLRAEGVRAGIPDLCLPVARGGAHGLYIEMKAVGGRESPAQCWWRERLVAQGYRAVVCVCAADAIETLEAYLSQPRTVVA